MQPVRTGETLLKAIKVRNKPYMIGDVVTVKREGNDALFRIDKIVKKRDGRIEIHCWGGSAYVWHPDEERFVTKGNGYAAYRAFLAQRIKELQYRAPTDGRPNLAAKDERQEELDALMERKKAKDKKEAAKAEIKRRKAKAKKEEEAKPKKKKRRLKDLSPEQRKIIRDRLKDKAHDKRVEFEAELDGAIDMSMEVGE